MPETCLLHTVYSEVLYKTKLTSHSKITSSHVLGVVQTHQDSSLLSVPLCSGRNRKVQLSHAKINPLHAMPRKAPRLRASEANNNLGTFHQTNPSCLELAYAENLEVEVSRTRPNVSPNRHATPFRRKRPRTQLCSATRPTDPWTHGRTVKCEVSIMMRNG